VGENGANTRDASRKAAVRELEGDVQTREEPAGHHALEGELGDLVAARPDQQSRDRRRAHKRPSMGEGESRGLQTGSLTIATNSELAGPRSRQLRWRLRQRGVRLD
jgi:hypothetical protein